MPDAQHKKPLLIMKGKKSYSFIVVRICKLLINREHLLKPCCRYLRQRQDSINQGRM